MIPSKPSIINHSNLSTIYQQTALEKAHEANDAGLHKEITQIRVHIGQVTAKLKPEAVATAPIEDQATQLIQLARSGAFFFL